jgi:hypothetical protein
MSCGCSNNPEVFYAKAENTPDKKGYLRIEGFSNIKESKENISTFKNKYKKYLDSQNKKNLDENAKNFYESFDTSTEEILNKGRENKELREELDRKMKELYNTIQSESYEREKIANMYKIRDIIVYSISAVVLYYLLQEL